MTAGSIRNDLVRRLLIALILVAVGSNTGLYFYLRAELTEQYDDALRTEAMAIATVWDPADADMTRQSARIARAFDHLHFGRGDGDFIKIVRRDGSTALHVPDVAGDGQLRTDDLVPFGARRRLFDLTLPNGRAGRAITIPFPRRVGVAGGGGATRPAEPPYLVVLAEGRHELDETLAHMALGLLGIGGGLSAVSIWLVVDAVRRGLKPLERFSESAERLDANSLHLRIPVDGLPVELRPIADRLNDMLARLDASFARERRFNDNVAHELRTPLAELRTMVEVAMRWPTDAAELGRHHASVLAVVERMSAVVQSLLQLSRSGAVQADAAPTPVDVIATLRTAWSAHEADARERGLTLDLDAAEGLIVDTDPALLTSIFDNLLSNAVAYATAGSAIRCEAARDEMSTAVVVRISNAATGLSEEDLARFEEPFWRKDAARSAGHHAGLGLSLVRAYATAIGARLRFVMPAPDRVTAEVTCPLRPHPREPASASAR